MRTILAPVQTDFTDKGSKFINFLHPVESEEEIQQCLADLSDKYPDASHHCYAWRIGPEHLQEYANDDGEPGGTAGLPILNALKSAELVNILCVSVRYFGGTKLGKPGLINAYRSAAETCIEQAKTGELHPITEFEVHYPYAEQKHIDQLIHHQNVQVLNNSFGASVSTHFVAGTDQKEEIAGILTGLAHRGISFTITKNGYGIRPE